MTRLLLLLWGLVVAVGCASVERGSDSAGAPADENKGIGDGENPGALPKPKDLSNVDLLKALRGRHSTRSLDDSRAIPDDVLATILWAADGVNRPDGKRTAPCAMGIQHKRIYICRADGVWRYDQVSHALISVGTADIRPSLSRQKHMATAPVVLVLASDLAAFSERMPNMDAARRREWSQAAAGCMAQNIYLTAEAFGIGTVMAAGMNAEEVSKGLALKEEEVPLYLMPLGYPKAE